VTARPSALFYVQHLLGIGHLQRTLAIAAAAAEAGIDATVASGGPAPSAPPNVRLIQLPPVRARDEEAGHRPDGTIVHGPERA